MTTKPGFIQTFSDWAVDPNPGFSPASRKEARLSFVDTLACMMAGAGAPQTGKAYSAMLDAGANGAVKTVCGNPALTATAAALVNGTAAHAQDFDDYEAIASTHPGAPIISALLALAELDTVSIGEAVNAFLVGYEAITRIGEALGYAHYMRGWHATSTIGPIGAAAACAHLLDLRKEEIANALALSMSASSGLKGQFGSDTKAIHAGLAARAGVESALLAKNGITANHNLMEDESGFVEIYGTSTSPGAGYATSRIGSGVSIEENPVLRKPWPSCAYTHRSIEAASSLAQKNDFDAETIISGAVSVPAPYARVAGFRNPVSINQARFSLGYCVASTLIDGEFGVHSLTQEALQRPEVKALEAKLDIHGYDAGAGLKDMSSKAPDTIKINLTGGVELSEAVADVKGGKINPMTEEDIRQKSTSCTGSAAIGDYLLLAGDNEKLRFPDFYSANRN